MCTRPQTMFSEAAGREITVSCRTCDACVAVRRKNWVARAMAEKAMHPQTFVVALTYSDETQFTRDGAAFFRYDDVRLFLARLRDAIKQATGSVAALRFLAAGEQGSKKGRCHWHVVLYSDVDLLTIGEYRAPWGVVTEYKDIVAPPRVDMPRNWTMWPHGFVQVQEPDEGGMHYALSYALKDQFGSDRSRDSGRVSRSEQFATGLFRMSKSPPIGAPWVDEQIYDMYCRGYAPPKLEFQVPQMRGYWYPSGTLRRRLLEGCRRVNDSFKAQYGRNVPQWTTLVHNCEENEGDLETLGIKESDDEETSLQTAISFRAREAAAAQEARAIARSCGRAFPCGLCIRGLPDAVLAEKFGLGWQGDQLFYQESGASAQILLAPGGGSYKDNPKASGVNAACGLRETKSRRRVFLQTAR